MVPGGVEAEDNFGACRVFDADPLRADGHPAIRAELESGPLASNIRPARTARGWADGGNRFFRLEN